MAIVSVTEAGTGRETMTGQNGRRIYRRMFIVVTSNPKVGEAAVKAAIGIPRIYEPYATSLENDSGAIVRVVAANQRENHRMIWDVTVDYDSEFEPFENPFTEPPDIRADTEIYDQPLPGRAAVFYDVTSASPTSQDPAVAGAQLSSWGQGITSSAGEPFDPPHTQPASRPIVSHTKNYAAFAMATKVLYENSVNLTPWCGLQARQAWCRSVKAQGHVHKSTTVGIADIYYARVEIVFALKAETWDLQLLDIGSYYLDYASGVAVRKAFEVEGTGEKRLGLLDHSVAAQPGKKLAAGQGAQFLRWRTKREVDFTPLGIDLNLALTNRRARRRS